MHGIQKKKFVQYYINFIKNNTANLIAFSKAKKIYNEKCKLINFVITHI